MCIYCYSRVLLWRIFDIRGKSSGFSIDHIEFQPHLQSTLLNSPCRSSRLHSSSLSFSCWVLQLNPFPTLHPQVLIYCIQAGRLSIFRRGIMIKTDVATSTVSLVSCPINNRSFLRCPSAELRVCHHRASVGFNVDVCINMWDDWQTWLFRLVSYDICWELPRKILLPNYFLILVLVWEFY